MTFAVCAFILPCELHVVREARQLSWTGGKVYEIQTESERLKIERFLDHVIFKQSSMVSSPCCFAEGGNEMYLICVAPVLHLFLNFIFPWLTSPFTLLWFCFVNARHLSHQFNDFMQYIHISIPCDNCICRVRYYLVLR